MAGNPRRILIVEDQAILGMELELALVQAGHEVVGVARDRRQALLLAEVRRPELALVDLVLKDGHTGASAALSLVRNLGVGVLFLTGEPDLIPEGFAGAYGAVVKPYEAQSVVDAVAFGLRLRDGAELGPAPSALVCAPWLSSSGNGPAH